MRGHFHINDRLRRLTAAALLFCAMGPITAAHAETSLTLEAESDHAMYREGAENEIYIAARIRTESPAAKTATDSARNIVFVLDRSGSMAGEPIQALRQALGVTLDSLADRDVVSVVVFGSEVETLIEAQRVDQARDHFARIAQIEPAGGAALYDALNQAAAQLRRYAAPSTINRLILVSDGRPTKGPREFDDFSKLAELFAREGTTISTIGLGEEFDEDLLAALARIGNGHFRFADKPLKLGDTLQAEIVTLQTIVARDAVLTIEYQKYCGEVKTHGTRAATVDGKTVTYRLPLIYAGQDIGVLASGTVESFRSRIGLSDIVTARLRWIGATDGEPHETSKTFSFTLTTDSRALRDTANARVYRAAVGASISEGMQDAIEQLDKGDVRRALRALRKARNDARDLNYPLDDPAIAAQIHQLDTYLAEVEARGLNQLDRKILRSGIFNQFELPVADDAAKKN